MIKSHTGHLARLLIVLLVLAALISPSTTALAAVTGQDTAPGGVDASQTAPTPEKPAEDGPRAAEQGLPGRAPAAADGANATTGVDRYVSTNGNDAYSCTIRNKCKTIGRAIAISNDGDRILISPGTYNQGATVNNSLTLQAEWGVVVIDGQNQRNAFYIPSGKTVTLANLTIQNGNGIGGGILNTGNLTLSNVTIKNSRSESGGGVHNNGGTLTLNNSHITDNTATSNGGGIFNGNRGTVTIDQASTLTRNVAQSGGGIYNDGGTVTVKGGSAVDKNLAYGNVNLAAYWPFEGNSKRDDSGNGHDGTSHGPPSYDYYANGTPAQLQSRSNIVFGFRGDGTNEYFTAALNVSESAYALSLWFKTACTDCGIFQVDNGNLDGSMDRTVYLDSGNLCARTYNAGPICTSGTNYADDTWHHVVHTFGSAISGQRLYVDGALKRSNTKTFSDFNWDSRITIGFARDATTRYFTGRVDDVRIYNRALTAIQVEALAAGADLGNGGGIYSTGSAAKVTVEGNSHISGNAAEYGGGLYSLAGEVTLIDSTIGGDTATKKNTAVYGGGIYSQAKVTLTNSFISRNTAAGNGGGILIGTYGQLTLNGSFVRGNVATGNGGGIHNYSGTVDLTNSTIGGTAGEGNTAQNGGGIYNDGSLDVLPAQITFINSKVRGNTATGKGGGIYNIVHDAGAPDRAELLLNTGSKIEKNSAAGDGGGIYNDAGKVILNGSFVSGNGATTGNGGGIYNTGNTRFNTHGVVEMTQSTVGGNTTADKNTAQSGGGIYSTGNTAQVILNARSFVSGNEASENGGGIYSSGTLTLTTSTVGGETENEKNWAGKDGGGIYNIGGSINLANGSVVKTNGAAQKGGGIWNGVSTFLFSFGPPATLTIEESTIGDNRATQDGGGIFNFGPPSQETSQVTINGGSLIHNNQTITGNGGGVSNLNGRITVETSTISENKAIVGSGGGIYNEHSPITVDSIGLSGHVAIKDGSFVSANSAITGGGVSNVGGMVAVTNSTIGGKTDQLGNRATANGGGIHMTSKTSGIFVNSQIIVRIIDGQLTIDGSAVRHNRATQNGGGLYLSGAGAFTANPVTVESSSISNNRADNGSGGGIFNRVRFLTLTNSTVSQNDATVNGGGIRNEVAWMHTYFVTFYDNRAESGLNLSNGSAISKLYATIVAQPLKTTSNCAGSVSTDSAWNRVSDDSCGLPLENNNQANATILLDGDLANNGSATLNHLPTPSRQNAVWQGATRGILDQIPRPDCVDGNGTFLDLDQRGLPRLRAWSRQEGDSQAAYCDVGAVEYYQQTRYVCPEPANDEKYGNGGRQEYECDTNSITQALADAVDDDTIVVIGQISENVVVNKSVKFRGPTVDEATPDTHMGIVKGNGTAATFTIGANGACPYAEVTIRNLNIRRASGGLGIRNSCDLILDGVTVYETGTGTGIQNNGVLSVTNSTLVVGTTAINNLAGAVLEVTHSTVRSGIVNQGTATIRGSIVSSCSGAGAISGGYNLNSGGACSGINTVSTEDPDLGPLRDNGGPTLTMAIQSSDSPAVTYDATGYVCTVATDQRGKARPLNADGQPGGKCDLGAVEYGPQTLTVCDDCTRDPDSHRYTDLQEALDRALAGDTVAVEAGTYTGNFTAYKDGTIRHAGLDISGINPQEIVEVRALVQASPDPIFTQAEALADTRGSGLGSVLTVQGYAVTANGLEPGADVAVTLQDLTIRYGMALQGGGIYNRGDLTLIRTTVHDNVAVTAIKGTGASGSGEGGAVYSTGPLSLQRSTLSGNRAEYEGGAIFSAGPNAELTIHASSLAENVAGPLPTIHVVGVTDNGLEANTVPGEIQDGDWIYFESRGASQERTIAVTPDNLCNADQIIVPLSGAGLSDPLICSQGTITLKDTKIVTSVSIPVTERDFIPTAHTISHSGGDANIGHSLLLTSLGVGANCAGGINTDGYNLSQDDSCSLSLGTDMQLWDPNNLEEKWGIKNRPSVSEIIDPLQDNNQIDFGADQVSGYVFTHALLPDSLAVDRIPVQECVTDVEEHELNPLVFNASMSIRAGDILHWQTSTPGAYTVALEDGQARVRLIQVTGDDTTIRNGETVPNPIPTQLFESVAYRVYKSGGTVVGSGTITVSPRIQPGEALPMDQRGISLPLRGVRPDETVDRTYYHCDIGAYEFQPWVVGQPVPRPPSAVGSNPPTWELPDQASGQDNHLWSPGTAEDLVLRPSTAGTGNAELPVTATVIWNTDPAPGSIVELRQQGISIWPETPQLHVDGAPVNVNHDFLAGDFRVSGAEAFANLDPQTNASLLLNNVFRRSLEAGNKDTYTVLTLVDNNGSAPTAQAQVVRTMEWNTPGLMDAGPQQACEIGTELDYRFTAADRATVAHADPEGRPGYILAGDAFDGVETAGETIVVQNTVDGLIPPAHVRQEREGPILPVLETAPTGSEDLRVAWYRPDSRNVAWPVKAAGYQCNWPDNPPQIVIASELGSEIGGQIILDPTLYGEPTIYHQPVETEEDGDPRPGYSPNWEHALLAPSNLGNPAPALYALRTDLADRLSGGENDSYALLKYRDLQNEGRVQMKVYQVKLTQPPAALVWPHFITPTVQAGNGTVTVPGGQVIVPVEVETTEALHAITATVTYDPAQVTPVGCTPNRNDFIAAPHGLQLFSDSPMRSGWPVHFEAHLQAGTDVQYHWNFGDGSPVRIAGAKVSTVYPELEDVASNPPYTVIVTATNGLAEQVATILVDIEADAIPTALPENSTNGCRIQNYLFNVDAAIRTNLPGQIPSSSALRQQFAAMGTPLSNNASATGSGPWQIQENGQTYTLIQRGDRIHIYQGARTANTQDTLLFQMQARNKHGEIGTVALADITFGGNGASILTAALVGPALGPDYSRLRYDITAGNPVYAPTPLRGLLDVQVCEGTQPYLPAAAKPYWEDFKGQIWARSAGEMEVLYFYPLQPGFYVDSGFAEDLGLDATTPEKLVGQCVPWMHNLETMAIAEEDQNITTENLEPGQTIHKTPYGSPSPGTSRPATLFADGTAVSIPYVDVADSLAIWWKLDNNLEDASGSSRLQMFQLNWSNQAWANIKTNWIPDIGNLKFPDDGWNDYIDWRTSYTHTVPTQFDKRSSHALSLSGDIFAQTESAFDIENDFTLSLWVKPSDLVGIQPLISRTSNFVPNNLLTDRNLVGSEWDDAKNYADEVGDSGSDNLDWDELKSWTDPNRVDTPKADAKTQLQLEIRNDEISFRIGQFSVTGGSITTDWQHLAVVGTTEGVEDGKTSVTLYLNGEAKETATLDKRISTVASDITHSEWLLGAEYWYGLAEVDCGLACLFEKDNRLLKYFRYFTGEIDDARIYNEALSDEQVQKLSENLVTRKVMPVAYNVSWPVLAPVLTVGETVFERPKNGISGVAEQLAVTRIYDDQAKGTWNDVAKTVDIAGQEAVEALAQLMDPVGEVRVELPIVLNDNPSLPSVIKSQRLLFGGGNAIVGNTDDPDLALPFSLRSRVLFEDAPQDIDGDGTAHGVLVFKGYYDGASPAYIKGDPLLLLNVMSDSDRKRLWDLCPGGGETSPFDDGTECGVFKNAIEDLYWKSLNPRQLDLCRYADGTLYVPTGPISSNLAAGQTATAGHLSFADAKGKVEKLPYGEFSQCPQNTNAWRDGVADRDFLIAIQDSEALTEPGSGRVTVIGNGIPEPYEGLGKGKAVTAGSAAGTGYVTLAYNNDDSLGGLPVSLQVIQVGCTQNQDGEDSTYRGNLLTIESDNLFDEKLTLRHTGDFGGRPDGYDFEWYYAPVDDTGVSPTTQPPAYPWRKWNGTGAGTPEITIEGANVTTLSDNWFVMRYKGYDACGNSVRYSAYAGDPSAKPSELRAQLAQGWIKRVTNALNPFDARVDDFVSSPVNSTVDMIAQAGRRYEGPVALSNDPDTLNKMGLIEAYQTVLDRGRSLSIDSNINDQGANAALLNVTTRIADLYMLLANDAYMDALDPTVALGTNSAQGFQAPTLFSFMNQFNAAQFGLIDEELALLRGRDETLGGVAAAPTYNRLTWNFTNGLGEVAYVQNYNMKDWNQDGFVNEADAFLRYPQGHGDAWGHTLTALSQYYQLLRHPQYTWSPRAEPISVAGAPVVVDYYDERRFAIDAAAKAQMGAEIVDLTYRKHWADPESAEYVDSQIDASDGMRRAWGVDDWARRGIQGAYFDWAVANAILPVQEERFEDVRKIDRSTVLEVGQIAQGLSAIQEQLDQADQGGNPLGLATNAVLFDLDPSRTQTGGGGLSHYEQVYERALAQLGNSMVLFNRANDMKVALRESQNQQRSFVQQIVDKDRAIINELIELFGYPYGADIGINGTYPEGYEGPDIYNYDLYDRNALTDAQKRCSEGEHDKGECPAETKTFLLTYNAMPCIGLYPEPIQSTLGADGVCSSLNKDSDLKLEIEHQIGIGLDAGRGRFKPASWPEGSGRKAVGGIPNALQALTEARLEYEMAILAYQNHVEAMDEKQKAIKERIDWLETKHDLFIAKQVVYKTYDTTIATIDASMALSKAAKEEVTETVTGFAECPPGVVGVSTDGTSTLRCGILTSVSAGKKVLTSGELALGKLKIAAEIAKNIWDLGEELGVYEVEKDNEIKQLGREMKGLLREEREKRLALFLAQDKVGDAQGGYDQVLQRAFRKLQELILLRQRWAGQISEQRYGDMAYRTAQIDALSKYRKQFDLAQQYVYLTAAAYDYETNLAVDDPAGGDTFLREIVGERTLGELRWQAGVGLEPIVGAGGLAESLGAMKDNFSVLKGQMGFNNPQDEATIFSLRKEHFRLREESDTAWRRELARYYTPDIFANDDVARLAKRPFGAAGPQPGLVIPFDSSIIYGLNFFGQPLGPGDSAFDASQFATKIAAVGVLLDDYDTNRLTSTPRVYLLPAGRDVMRPRGSEGILRYWNISEQLLPLPYTLGQTELQNPNWIPRFDGLSGRLFETKRHAQLRAYAFDEEFAGDPLTTDTRLIGRSVWNTQWLLVIPGRSLLADPAVGIDRFIEDVSDIHLYFQTYSYAGATRAALAETPPSEVDSTALTQTANPISRTARRLNAAHLAPVPDAITYGPVRLNGVPKTDGTVKALLPDGSVLSAPIGEIRGTGYGFVLDIPMGMAAGAAGATLSGDGVQFFVDDQPAYFGGGNGLSTNLFSLAENSAGQPHLLNLRLGGPASFVLGDVNASGRRDAADALLTMKYDVALAAGVTEFPPGPNTVYLPLCDIEGDGQCNSVDALRILRCDVGLTPALCPTNPVRSLAVSSAQSSADAALGLSAQITVAPAGDRVTVRILAADPVAELGAASLSLDYPAERLEPVACESNPESEQAMSACNLEFAPGAIRFSIVQSLSARGGITGSQAMGLVEITFQLRPAQEMNPSAAAAWFSLQAQGVFDQNGDDLAYALAPTPGQTNPEPSNPGPGVRIYLPIFSHSAPGQEVPDSAGEQPQATADHHLFMPVVRWEE